MIRLPFSFIDLVHGMSREMEMRVLELNFGLACEDLEMWNFGLNDERDGIVSSPRRWQPQKAQEAMAQVAASEGFKMFRLEQRMWRCSIVIGLRWGHEKVFPSLLAVDLARCTRRESPDHRVPL